MSVCYLVGSRKGESMCIYSMKRERVCVLPYRRREEKDSI